MSKIIKILATGFGVGNIHVAPGTWGSLLGILLALFIPISIPLIVVTAIIGVFICHEGEKIIGEPDSPSIIFDEIVGMWISVIFLPINYFLLAFVVFRFFDILKPFPINISQKLPGGLGIMIDDILAGLATRAVLFVLISYLL